MALTMSTVDQTIDQVTWATGQAGADLDAGQAITLELRLAEAQALRNWLMKPTKDGANSLEEPLVSHFLANLGRAVDGVQAAVNVRRELEQAGLTVAHLSDEQVRELGRKVTEAAMPGIRS
jgi:hypothetical protein